MFKNKVTLFTSNGKYESSGFIENMILGILSEVSQYDNQVRTERSRLGTFQLIDKKTQLTIRNTIPQLISNKLWDEVQERKKVLLKRNSRS
jgi:hypothetical protein